MRTKLNQIGTFGAASRNAAFIFLFTLLFAIKVASENLAFDNAVIYLSAKVSSAEIQQALDSLPDSGGEVVLSAGRFDIQQPVVLRRDRQTLRGVGPATVLRLVDNANCPVVIMGEPVNHPQKTLAHLQVRDLSIDGNRSHQQRELWREQGEGSEIRNNGITIQSVCDSSVEHVIASRCRSGGVVTTLGVRRLTVRSLEAFDNEFDGLACYLTAESLFTDLYLHDNPGAGISLDLAFNNNVIRQAVLARNDLGIFMRASRENVFYDVFIRNSGHFGVFMAHAEEYGTGVARPAPQTECVRNAFTNLVAINCGGAAFRVNNSTCTDNVIIRPSFDKNHRGGLSLAQPDLVTVR
ncbi:MAG: right-handed parallel beta-helix repeat-containing protein [Verrucomicrobiota bacterium]